MTERLTCPNCGCHTIIPTGTFDRGTLEELWRCLVCWYTAVKWEFRNG